MPTSNVLGTGVESRARLDAAKIYESSVKSSPNEPHGPGQTRERVPLNAWKEDGKRVRRVLASREDPIEGQFGDNIDTT